MAEVAASTMDGRRLRGQRTRERILDAARRLFREQGFLSVSMEAIGDAAGISAPAIYRHFARKEDVLVAVLSPVTELLWPTLERDGDPFETLERCIATVATTAIEERDLIVLWHQEWRNLPAAERDEIRLLVPRWIEGLSRLLREGRADLSAAEARVVMEAALGVALSVGHPGTKRRLPPDTLHATRVRLSLAVLRG